MLVALNTTILATWERSLTPPTGRIDFASYDTGSSNWTIVDETVHNLALTPGQTSPDIAAVAAPCVVYVDNGANSKKDLYVRRRSPPTNMWGVTTINADVDPNGAPVVTRLKDGRLLVVFNDSATDTTTEWRSLLEDAGVWKGLSAIGSFSQRPSLAALADGRAMVAWIDANNDIQVMTFDPNATMPSWSPATNVSGSTNNVLGIVSVTRGLNGATAELMYELVDTPAKMMHARLVNGVWTATQIPGLSGQNVGVIAAPPLP